MPYYMHELNPAFGLIKHLSTDELKDLLNNDERLDAMINDLPQVKNLETEKEILMASNKSIAEFNLSFEPCLQQTREQLVKLYEEANVLKKEVEEKKKNLDELTRQTSMDTTQALLQTAAAQTEEETEILTEKFMANELTVEAFLEEFLAKRKLAHLRRIKAEKMADILNRIPTNPGNNHHPARPAPPVPAPNKATTSSHQNYYVQPPYPVSGSGLKMPMPQYR